MNRTTALCALCLVFSVGIANTQEKRQEEVKWNLDYLDKECGIKMKSVTLTEGTFKILFEFTKDVPAKEAQELFKLDASGSGKFATAYSKKMNFYFFDAENVVITRTGAFGVEGELTGKKGDAFRVHLKIEKFVEAKVKKIELRPAEMSK